MAKEQEELYEPASIDEGIKAQPLPPQDDGEIPVIRWNNRRKMAWYAFYALLVYTAMYWFALPLWFQHFTLPTAWLEIIGESFWWFATTMAAVILGYMGFTSLPFMGRAKGKKKVEMYDEDY